MKFTTVQPDSLIGLLIHFVPFFDDVQEENFLLRAWDDNGGVPGAEMGENFQFNNPVYYQAGYNVFTYYAYDDPIFVSGSFFVGWVQDTGAKLSLGNDKNTNSNIGNLYYQLGIGAPWTASEIPGSVMIRPVFRSGKQDPWAGLEDAQMTLAPVCYPNPTERWLHIAHPDLDIRNSPIRLYDMAGRVALEETASGSSLELDLAGLHPGMYLLVTQLRGGAVFRKSILLK